MRRKRGWSEIEEDRGAGSRDKMSVDVVPDLAGEVKEGDRHNWIAEMDRMAWSCTRLVWGEEAVETAGNRKGGWKE